MVVRSPSEALIHSRNSRFAVIVLPDNDPVLIRKVRSVKIAIAQNIIQVFSNGITSLFCNRLTISPVFIKVIHDYNSYCRLSIMRILLFPQIS